MESWWLFIRQRRNYKISKINWSGTISQNIHKSGVHNQKLDPVADPPHANSTRDTDTHPFGYGDHTVNLIFGCIDNWRSFISRQNPAFRDDHFTTP